MVARLLTEHDIYLFREGTHFRAYEKLGAPPPRPRAGRTMRAPISRCGPRTPRASRSWATSTAGTRDRIRSRPAATPPASGRRFVPGVAPGRALQVPHRIAAQRLHGREGRPVRVPLRAPAAHRLGRVGPRLRVGRRRSGWQTRATAQRARRARGPSTRCTSARGDACPRSRQPLAHLSRAGARSSATTCSDMGFTHVELMPVMEHPFYGSWGYQVTGYFAPTSRYGTPQDFMYLVDHLHQRGIGVILDWVPSHFPTDEHGLAYFDGTHLYEHADPRQGFHPEWNSSIFNYGRAEVRNFLAQQRPVLARQVPHRRRCAWTPSPRCSISTTRARPASGSRTSTAATRTSKRSSSCKQLNLAVYRDHPDTQTIAEESTAWPMVSRPTYLGGLGLRLQVEHGLDARHARSTSSTDPIHRKYHHNQLTFSICTPSPRTSCCRSRTTRSCTARARCIGKMPGDEWQQFANLRAAVRLHVGAPGQEAAVHGRRVRAAARVDARREPRVARAAVSAARRRAALGARPESLLPADAGAARAATSRTTASSGSTATTATRACCRSCARARRPTTSCWSCATSRRCRATTTRRRAARRHDGASGSTAMRTDYGGSGIGNSRRRRSRARCRRMAGFTR